MLTLDQLRILPAYLRLTDKQQKFVEAYVSNGLDSVKAVMAAYQYKSERVARIRSYAVMESPHIVFVLALYFEESAKDDFLRHMNKMILKGKITPAQYSTMRLYASLQGWTMPSKAVATESEAEPEEIDPDQEPEETPSLLDDFGDQ